MSISTKAAQHLEELRAMVAEVLEVEPEEISETGDLATEHGADSLQAIEILAEIEKAYDIEISPEQLAQMVTLRAIYEIVASLAGWES